MTKAFTSHQDTILDSTGTVWTIDEATKRLHIIADLMSDLHADLEPVCGAKRFFDLSAAIREAKRWRHFKLLEPVK